MPIIELASGPAYTLYARIENDVCQVRAYIASLPEKDQKQVFALLKFILEQGIPMNKEKFRHIGDQIYELKTRGGIRILCFFGSPVLPDALILTHGFRKPKPKRLIREKDKTLQWRKQYFATTNPNNNFNIVEEHS